MQSLRLIRLFSHVSNSKQYRKVLGIAFNYALLGAVGGTGCFRSLTLVRKAYREYALHNSFATYQPWQHPPIEDRSTDQ